ncbi:hypothetical protein ASALC70_02655 [Alcanivorax sp. ALC70]|nr:hypothetical protein ASALC70_02655 [Alcanivorax sp. ALC70]
MALLRSFVLILGSALLLAACARSPVVQLYDGAQKPDAQVLTVRVPSDLEVFTINGQEIDGVNTFFSSGYKDLKLTPAATRSWRSTSVSGIWIRTTTR